MAILLLLALGLVVGSFVNALVWRLNEQGELEDRKSKSQKIAARAKPRKELSILTGRSMCPFCRHELAAKDLVPVASWVWLRGKCRYCHAPIAWQYPAVELLTAGLFIASYIWWPHRFTGAGVFDFGLWLTFVTAFMALAVYDLRWFLLPDRIVLPLIGLAAIKVIVDAFVFGGGISVIAMAALATSCIAGLFYILYIISRGVWIGFGDVKLAIVLGLLAGRPTMALLLLFVAALLGTLAAVPLLVRGRVTAKSQIPFGPFLLTATFLIVLFGGRLLTWYAHLLYLG
jgi:prepilin signal peptidase PulO-like enzyme (type II secretory pathway)